MFRCQTAGCGKTSNNINDFVIGGSICVCLSCAERINAETERREMGNGEEAPMVDQNVSDEEGTEMTIEKLEPPADLEIEKS